MYYWQKTWPLNFSYCCYFCFPKRLFFDNFESYGAAGFHNCSHALKGDADDADGADAGAGAGDADDVDDDGGGDDYDDVHEL